MQMHHRPIAIAFRNPVAPTCHCKAAVRFVNGVGDATALAVYIRMVAVGGSNTFPCCNHSLILLLVEVLASLGFTTVNSGRPTVSPNTSGNTIAQSLAFDSGRWRVYTSCNRLEKSGLQLSVLKTNKDLKHDTYIFSTIKRT